MDYLKKIFESLRCEKYVIIVAQDICNKYDTKTGVS